MLRREDSNKILKGVKVFLFATSLSLLNPINVEAKEPNQQKIEENLEMKKIIVGTTLGGSLAISLVGIAVYAHKLKKYSSNYEMYGIEDKSSPNEEETTKHLKIIYK